jgi:hypothetical protein
MSTGSIRATVRPERTGARRLVRSSEDGSVAEQPDTTLQSNLT